MEIANKIIHKFIYFLLLSFLSFSYSWAIDYDKDYGRVDKLDTPTREHAIIVAEEGYYPQGISLFAGEKLRIFLTSTVNHPTCLMLPQKELFLGVSKGRIAEGEVVFERPGIYHFFCPTGKIKGKVTVLKKIEKEANSIKREIASKKKTTRFWMPRGE